MVEARQADCPLLALQGPRRANFIAFLETDIGIAEAPVVPENSFRRRNCRSDFDRACRAGCAQAPIGMVRCLREGSPFVPRWPRLLCGWSGLSLSAISGAARRSFPAITQLGSAGDLVRL